MHNTCSDIIFQTHECADDDNVDDRPIDAMNNIGPDNHFYNKIPTNKKYYSVYRTLGSDIDQFCESIVQLFTDVMLSKSTFVCGDFNIDLLKLETHNGTLDIIKDIRYYIICYSPYLMDPFDY